MRVRRWCALLGAALVAALAVCLPADDAAAEPARVPGPVVVVGIAGLTWQDVDPDTTPTLWRMAGEGSAGSMTARVDARLTCPVEAWLTIGSGSRALMPTPEGAGESPTPTPTSSAAETRCADYPRTRVSGGERTVAGWSDFVEQNAGGEYGTKLGVLPDVLADQGECVGAVGPGAVLASATPDGRVTGTRGSLGDLDDITARCPLTFVDGGIRPGPAEAEATAAAVTRAVPDATVLVLGVSDRYDYAQMHVAIATGPAMGTEPFDRRWLGSASTRRDNIVQLTDVTPTLLEMLGHGSAKTGQMVGAPMRATAPYGPDTTTADVVETLSGVDRANKVSRDLTPAFIAVLEVGQLVIYLIAAIGLRRRWSTPGQRKRVLQVVRTSALVGASVLPATFLANLVPWSRVDHPLPALIGACAVFVAAILGVAVSGPWRRHVIGPPTVVAAAMAVVLGADVMTGSNMQLSSVLGYPVVIGARFYGFGNTMFALFATGTLLFLAGLYHWLATRLPRYLVLLLVLVLGGFAVLLDGWPAFGSDFGGVIAFVPGVIVLALLLTGRRLNVKWLLGVAASGVLVVGVIAFLDYRRPSQEQSHLGRFVGQVLNGEAWQVVLRKLGANLSILVSSYGLALLIVVGVLFLAFVLLRPVEWRAPALQRVFVRAPEFRAGLLASLVTLVIGGLLNDSGIAIPAMGMMFAIPLAIAASARAVEDDDPAPQPADADEPSSSRQT